MNIVFNRKPPPGPSVQLIDRLNGTVGSIVAWLIVRSGDAQEGLHFFDQNFLDDLAADHHEQLPEQEAGQYVARMVKVLGYSGDADETAEQKEGDLKEIFYQTHTGPENAVLDVDLEERKRTRIRWLESLTKFNATLRWIHRSRICMLQILEQSSRSQLTMVIPNDTDTNAACPETNDRKASRSSFEQSYSSISWPSVQVCKIEIRVVRFTGRQKAKKFGRKRPAVAFTTSMANFEQNAMKMMI